MDYLRRRLSDGNFLAGGVGGGLGDPQGVGGPPRTPPPTAPLLLVISPPGTDWVKLFKGKSVHGDVELRVEQAQFSELSLVASTHGALSVTIDTPKGGARRVHPDFVLVREPPGGGAGGHPRRLLLGLHLGGVPSAPPLPALYGCTHPPWLFAQLTRLQRELGPEAFPLVPQQYCNRPRGLLSSPTFPVTVTLSPSPPGVGKVRVAGAAALGVVAGAMGAARAGALLLRGGDGTPGTLRLRLQRIGDQYRALRWPLAAGEAPGEGAQVEPMALSTRHRGWLDACSRLFGGGPQICGVEALRGPDGRELILEVLGSWLPLVGPGAAEDEGRIVELVLGRMRAELPRPRSPSPARTRPQATSGSQRPGTPPQQRPAPQGAPPPSGPAQPRPQPQGQPRPPVGGAWRGPAPSPTPSQRGSGQPRPQAPPTSPQPRPQAQPRPQSPANGVQPRPQAPPTAQPRPQSPANGVQPRPQAPPTSPQPRPQTPPTSQPRPQAQPRPQSPANGAQPRPQAPPTSPQPRPQSPQPRPQSPQSRPPGPQAPPPTASPRPPGPQAPPTTRQPRPQAPPIAPKPVLAPKPSGTQPPSPAPEPGGAESIRSLRQSFASLFAD